MSLTLSGPVLALVILYVFVRRPDRMAELVVFFAPFSATAIVNLTALGYKSGGLGITPAMLSLGLFLLAQLCLGLGFRPVRVSAGLLVQVGLLGAFTLVFLTSLLVHGSYDGLSSFQVTQSVYVLLGLLTTVLFGFEFCREGAVERIVRVMRLSAVFVSAWGVLQVACFLTGLPYPAVMFNNSQSDAADMFEQGGPGFTRIASVAVEPSFFAASMLHFVCFGITILIAEPRLRTASWTVPVAFTTLVLVLSTSTTGYVGLAALSGLLLLRWPLRTTMAGMPALVAAGMVMLLSPKAVDVLAAVTVDKGDTFSYLDRKAGALKAYQVFLEHPVIGGGWSLAPNFNSVTATLGNVGVIGTLLFGLGAAALLFELQSRHRTERAGENWRLSAYAAGIQNALIVSFVCSVSSGIKYVVIDDWYVWGLGIAVSSLLHTAARRDPGPAFGAEPLVAARPSPEMSETGAVRP